VPPQESAPSESPQRPLFKRQRRGLSDFPYVIGEWDPRRNGDLRPERLRATSHVLAWWRCTNNPGHQWRASVANRTRGTGCPFCAGQRAVRETSLAATHAAVARQWDARRNAPLTPRDVLPFSHKEVWWKCPKGPDHQWCARISDRTHDGRGCPFCSGRRLSVTNSLATVAPSVASDWHPTKNGSLRPKDQLAAQWVQRWWKCRKGEDHVWRCAVAGRVQVGKGCPFCVGRRVSLSTSLAAVSPETARLWNRARNAGLTPKDVTAHSRLRVCWKCPRGPDHEWRATVADCVDATKKCHACVGLQVSVTNSLAARFPDVAAQWHPTKNGPLTPELVTTRTLRRVWWICDIGHSWCTRIAHRTAEKSGCPVCFELSRSGRPPRMRRKRRRVG
jgi:hypothetical protein